MAFFLCQLAGPRPSFALDMTEAEQSLMGAHAGYWGELLRSGQALVFGPVLDPQASWGLGIVETADAGAARTLTDNDPVILSGTGFSYNIHPMPVVMLRSVPAANQ
jgi:uncharacterized protein